MHEVSSMLQKIRTLAVQAANGTNTMDDKKALSKEASALATEVNRISMQTTFAGKTILNGTKEANANNTIFSAAANGAAGKAGTVTLQVGSNKGDVISFQLGNMMFSKIAEEGGIHKNGQNAGQIGQIIGGGADKEFTKANGGEIKVNFSNADAASKIISYMDKMIGYVDSQRADLGAIQNRLESSIRNQSNVAANEADARSRIRDADFAEESANLSQQSIIQQAAASMLMQANTRPQLGLSLLG